VAGPAGDGAGLTAFVVYATTIVFAVPGYFEIRQNVEDFFAPNNPAVAPYLAPFHSPLLFDEQSPHAWFRQARPNWWPAWLPFNAALLILIFPAGFRFTCYYYRKAYYRSFWLDPPACAVGEPRSSYWGENHWPLLIQNIHRYFMYFAVLFLVFLWHDAILAFWWPVLDAHGSPTGQHTFGIGLGSVIMLVNVYLLTGYTLGCHSFRHLIGGRKNCFSCPVNGQLRPTTSYRLWRLSTILNERHQLWAWLSLFSVGFTDLYIRLCAAGIWKDLRIL
jgi:hypothetical protein